MNNDFWLSKWRTNEIGFHQSEFNKYLVRYIDEFSPRLKNNTHCFVPLCGKTSDLVLLSKYFKQVSGIELAEKAVLDFFQENQLNPRKIGNHYSSKNISILNEDFFNLSLSNIKTPITHMYDRASIIALPDSYRSKYKKHINNIINEDTKIMIISIEYDQSKVSGPPFSVKKDEVLNTFPKHNLKILSQEETKNLSGKFENIKVIQSVYISTN